MGIANSIVNYFIKSGKSILINKVMQNPKNYCCRLTGELAKNGEDIIPDLASKANLGDASIFIDSILKQQLPEARAQVQLMFGDLASVIQTDHRAKGALSILPKLIRGINKADDKTFHSLKDAVNFIEDGVGSRVITQSLKKLSKTDIKRMVSEMTIDGKQLTSRQKDLLNKFIYEKPMHPREYEEGYKLYQQFATPLIEQRSQEVVNQLKLSIIKHRIESGELSVQNAEKMFGTEIVKKAQSSGILPLQIEEINNYRGSYGLAEFSDAQMADLTFTLNNGRVNAPKAAIYSDPGYSKLLETWGDDVDEALILTEKEAEKVMKKSIKTTGYRGAQMNVIHENGALGEIQFKGMFTRKVTEWEHPRWDFRQGKNTLGPVYDEYAEAVVKLNDKQYELYDKYIQGWYNYANRIELGLPAIKPKLPKGFNKILSMESMKHLYETNQTVQFSLNKDFTQYLAAA